MTDSRRTDMMTEANDTKEAMFGEMELMRTLNEDADAKPETMRSLAEKYSPDEIRVYEPSLNDIFIEYTREAEEVK